MLNREAHSNIPSYILVATAVVLGLIASHRVAQHLLFTTPPQFGESLITLAQAPFLTVMVYAAHKIRAEKWNDAQARRVLAWFAAGVIGFVTINALIMTFLLNPESGFMFIWLAWAASLGGGAGVLTGYFEGKAVVRARAREREVIRAQEAEAREELLDYLNSLLRHEVLNSASVIQGYSTLMLDEHDLDTNIKGWLETIDNQAVEMTSIIEDVRVLLDASKFDGELEPVNLQCVLEKELQKVTERFDGVETKCVAPDDVSVHGDALLRRIFSNLFSNAIEHNTTRTPRVSATVTTTTDEIMVQVSDNGPGFTDSEQETVFQSQQNGSPDHGLGLMLVKQLTKRYNATIELTETGPDGTTFTVTFPRQPTNTDSDETPAPDGARGKMLPATPSTNESSLLSSTTSD
jgi:signal transduction histidine kinase